MDALGWQALLAAEMSSMKSLALLRELGSVRSDWAAVIQRHPALSENERKRAAQLFPEKLFKAVELGVRIIPRAEFPEPLRSMSYPPAFFAWGDISCANLPSVAIVGTRGATTYGKAAAMKFAEAFARAGVTVISGGALGIDASAHRGALSQGGKTIAVLAGGIEQVYPAVHAGLFSRIRESGCLVSQDAVGSRPNGYRFLNRNHLIAGLSMAVLVVEAPERSGSLSTVNAANEQGKQVFVVPANIDNANFKGSHALIRDGASLVDHPEQVLDALGLAAAPAPAHAQLNGIGAKIVDALSESPLPIEFIAERTGLDASEIMAELTMLEIDGRVMRDGGKYTVRS
jgi:DNA processing protein